MPKSWTGTSGDSLARSKRSSRASRSSSQEATASRAARRAPGSAGAGSAAAGSPWGRVLPGAFRPPVGAAGSAAGAAARTPDAGARRPGGQQLGAPVGVRAHRRGQDHPLPGGQGAVQQRESLRVREGREPGRAVGGAAHLPHAGVPPAGPLHADQRQPVRPRRGDLVQEGVGQRVVALSDGQRGDRGGDRGVQHEELQRLRAEALRQRVEPEDLRAEHPGQVLRGLADEGGVLGVGGTGAVDHPAHRAQLAFHVGQGPGERRGVLQGYGPHLQLHALVGEFGQRAELAAQRGVRAQVCGPLGARRQFLAAGQDELAHTVPGDEVPGGQQPEPAGAAGHPQDAALREARCPRRGGRQRPQRRPVADALAVGDLGLLAVEGEFTGHPGAQLLVPARAHVHMPGAQLPVLALEHPVQTHSGGAAQRGLRAPGHQQRAQLAAAPVDDLLQPAQPGVQRRAVDGQGGSGAARQVDHRVVAVPAGPGIGQLGVEPGGAEHVGGRERGSQPGGQLLGAGGAARTAVHAGGAPRPAGSAGTQSRVSSSSAAAGPASGVPGPGVDPAAGPAAGPRGRGGRAGRGRGPGDRCRAGRRRRTGHRRRADGGEFGIRRGQPDPLAAEGVAGQRHPAGQRSRVQRTPVDRLSGGPGRRTGGRIVPGRVAPGGLARVDHPGPALLGLPSVRELGQPRGELTERLEPDGEPVRHGLTAGLERPGDLVPGPPGTLGAQSGGQAGACSASRSESRAESTASCGPAGAAGRSGAAGGSWRMMCALVPPAPKELTPAVLGASVPSARSRRGQGAPSRCTRNGVAAKSMLGLSSSSRAATGRTRRAASGAAPW